MRWWLTVGGAATAALAAAVIPHVIGGESDAATRPGGEFAVECAYSHRNADDPIVHPGHAGASHVHTYFGSIAADASASDDDVVAAPTTCAAPGDTAAYWVPQLLVDGTPVDPLHATAYYRVAPGMDASRVEAFPPGLKMVARQATWSCDAGAQRHPRPPDCPPLSPLDLIVTFPDCWDGVNLDSVDHERHVAVSRDGRCPASHPRVLPLLELHVSYPAADAARLTLASGSLATAHGDFWNTWDQDVLADRVSTCLRRGVVCRTARLP